MTSPPLRVWKRDEDHGRATTNTPPPMPLGRGLHNKQKPIWLIEMDILLKSAHLHTHVNVTGSCSPKAPPSYSPSSNPVLESTVMTQYSAKKGLEMFGDAGIEAIVKELKQLHMMKVLKLVDK